jgi:hypothetical protein
VELFGKTLTLDRLLKEFRFPTRPATLLFANAILPILNFCKNVFLSKNKSQKGHQNKGLAIYDLRCEGPSYEILHFLASMDLYFKKKGIEKFSVIVLEASEKYHEKAWKEHDQIFDLENQKLRIWNIVIPTVQMYKGCDSVLVTKDINKVIEECSKEFVTFPEHYDGVNLRRISQLGVNHASLNCFPFSSGLEAPSHALKLIEQFKQLKSFDKPLVTITIRNYAHAEYRNSNIEKFLKFAKYVEEIGYIPVFVPDTANSFQSFSPYESFPAASYNMFYRMALYESSFTNVFTSGGPNCLAQMNPKVSYISTDMLPPGSAPTVKKVYIEKGLTPGEQFFVHDSVWDWESTFDSLVKALHVVENKKKESQYDRVSQQAEQMNAFDEDA